MLFDICLSHSDNTNINNVETITKQYLYLFQQMFLLCSVELIIKQLTNKIFLISIVVFVRL